MRKGVQFGPSRCFWQPLDEHGRYDPDQLEPYFALPEFSAMTDNASQHYFELIKKSVLFVGTKEKGTFRPRATAFVASIRDQDIGFRYLVTADHVVSKLLAKNLDIWLRTNRKDGSSQEDNWAGAQWMFHPEVGSTDVAIAPINFSQDEDFRSLLLSGDKSLAATAEVLKHNNVNVGHEVFIAGLFRSHYGRQRNIPIIRTGNIAAMLGEKVYTKHCNYTDAYLIEARSISGLSGSPVFVRIEVRTNGILTGYRILLLGLMHGHFDVPSLTEDVVVDEDSGESRGINTGIGVVIPVEKILETVNQSEIQRMRKEGIDRHKKTKGATADADVSEAPESTDENPKHREDFMRLQSVAARKQKQDD